MTHRMSRKFSYRDDERKDVLMSTDFINYLTRLAHLKRKMMENDPQLSAKIAGF